MENNVAKGEIAHYKQFLLLPQCFQKLSAARASESACMWEMDKVKCLYCNQCIINRFKRFLKAAYED